ALIGHRAILWDSQLLKRCLLSFRHQQQLCAKPRWADRKRQRLWGAALLRAWRRRCREAAASRQVLRLLGAGARFRRGRRRSELLLLRRLWRLLSACVATLAARRRRRQQLRAKSAAAVATQQKKLLRAWVAAKRGRNSKCTTSCATLAACLFFTWAREVQISRVTSHMLLTNTSQLLASLVRSWARRTAESHSAREVAAALSSKAAARFFAELGRGGICTVWACWAREQRRCQGAARALRVQKAASFLRSCFCMWRAWSRQEAVAKKAGRALLCPGFLMWQHWTTRRRELRIRVFGCLLRSLLDSVRAWSRLTRRSLAIRQLVVVLDECRRRRWKTEEEWLRDAVQDQTLQAMFRYFVLAVGRHAEQMAACHSAHAIQLAGDNNKSFEHVVALVWRRQQLSVALARLKGSWQQWTLGMWPSASSQPFLPAGSPYFARAKVRLQLQALELQEGSGANSPEPKALWPVLADLLLVGRPHWELTSNRPLCPTEVGTAFQEYFPQGMRMATTPPPDSRRDASVRNLMQQNDK
ncbi:unnamed protein product, partial [Polarella glacialis]